MLVRSEQLSSTWAWMVFIIRLYEGVIREISSFTVMEELVVSSEDPGLIAKQVHNLHGGTGNVEIVQLSGAARVEHAVIDAHVRCPYFERIHADLPERCAVMRESSVADGGTGDG